MRCPVCGAAILYNAAVLRCSNGHPITKEAVHTANNPLVLTPVDYSGPYCTVGEKPRAPRPPYVAPTREDYAKIAAHRFAHMKSGHRKNQMLLMVAYGATLSSVGRYFGVEGSYVRTAALIALAHVSLKLYIRGALAARGDMYTPSMSWVRANMLAVEDAVADWDIARFRDVGYAGACATAVRDLLETKGI